MEEDFEFADKVPPAFERMVWFLNLLDYVTVLFLFFLQICRECVVRSLDFMHINSDFDYLISVVWDLGVNFRIGFSFLFVFLLANYSLIYRMRRNKMQRESFLVCLRLNWLMINILGNFVCSYYFVANSVNGLSALSSGF